MSLIQKRKKIGQDCERKRKKTSKALNRGGGERAVWGGKAVTQTFIGNVWGGMITSKEANQFPRREKRGVPFMLLKGSFKKNVGLSRKKNRKKETFKKNQGATEGKARSKNNAVE